MGWTDHPDPIPLGLTNSSTNDYQKHDRELTELKRMKIEVLKAPYSSCEHAFTPLMINNHTFILIH